jgi:hypothetical protein
MSLKNSFLATLFIAALVALAVGCSVEAMPRLDIKLWAGDSSNDRIYHRSTHESMLCRDEDFNGMVCMSYEDLKEIHDTLAKCEKWKPGTEIATMNQKMKLYRREHVRDMLREYERRR